MPLCRYRNNNSPLIFLSIRWVEGSLNVFISDIALGHNNSTRQLVVDLMQVDKNVNARLIYCLLLHVMNIVAVKTVTT